MRKIWLKVRIFFWLFLALAGEAQAFDHSHAAFTELLLRHLDAQGLVRYCDLQKSEPRQQLNRYVTELEKVQLSAYRAWSRSEQMAFLINAYNALTLKLVLDHYPVPSIKKIGGFFSSPWKLEFFSLLEGRAKALDKIEHEILRPDFRDYRIHAAVNCASLSCPPLRREAYTGAKLEAQLDEQMTLWLADPARNSFDAAKGQAKISKIFDWYGDDFEKWGQGLWTVLAKYGPPAAKSLAAGKGRISYLEYDWNLNEAKDQ